MAKHGGRGLGFADDADCHVGLGQARKRLLDIGSEIPAKPDRTPQALQKLVESEVARWSSLLKAAGVIAR